MLLLVLAIASQGVAIEDPAFKEAQRLVEDFEYERAVFRYREALRHEHPDPVRARIEVQLGLTYAQLGEDDDATEAFADALAHDADAAPPRQASSKGLALFEAGRARLSERRAEAARIARLSSEGEPAPEPAAPPPPDRSWERDPTWTYVGMGTATAGALSVAGGIATYMYALDLFGQGARAEFQDDARALGEQSTQNQYISFGLWGAGAALTVAGGAMIVLSE